MMLAGALSFSLFFFSRALRPIQPQGPTADPQVELIPEKYRKIGSHPTHQYGLEHSERDGLNLNIIVPLLALKEGAAPIPVMTYIYGGSLRNGHNAIPLYGTMSSIYTHALHLRRECNFFLLYA
jgi:para-nitrobenzyl esterase